MASGGGHGGVELQEFAYFVVMDLEATCESGRKIYPQEIIELASVVVDAATGELTAHASQAYVKPAHHPTLTDYCRDLTGIAQHDVDAGVDLRTALRAHDAWLATAGVKDGSFAVVTWGDWDCRVMLDGECRLKGIDGDGKPEYLDRWINLKVPFRQVFVRGVDGGETRRIGLGEAVAMAGMEFEGRPHCGLDDARNTARLVGVLMRRGARLAVTGALPPRHGHGVVRRCGCGVASRVGVARRAGPTQGRRFYGCGRWTPARGAVCSYFVWEEDVDLSNTNRRA